MWHNRWWRNLFFRPNTSRGQREQARRAGPTARPRLQVLEDRTVPSSFGTMATDLIQALGGLDTNLDHLLDAAAAVPFLNKEQGLLKAKEFLDNTANQLQTTLSAFQDPTDASLDQQLASAVTGQLYSALGPGGLKVVDSANDITVSITGAINPNANENDLNLGLEIHLHPILALVQSPNLKFDLGLPALPVEASAAGGVQLKVGFDFELKCGFDAATSAFSLATNNDVQHGGAQLNVHSAGLPYDVYGHLFAVEAQASLVNFSANLNVGFLGGTVVDRGPTELQAALVIDDLTQPSQVSLLGGADVNLGLTLGVTDGNGGPLDSQFPSLGTNLALHWNFNDNSAPTVAFNDVSLSLGALFSDIISPKLITYVQDFTKPLQPLFDVFKAKLPVLNVSLETLVDTAGQQGAFGQYGALVGLATHLVDITTFVNQISASGDQVMIDVGSFNVGGGDVDLRHMAAAQLPDVLKLLNPDQITHLTDPALWQPVLDHVGSVVGSLTSQLNSVVQNNPPNSPAAIAAAAALQLLPNSGNQATVDLNFPFFDDPAHGAFQLLLGQDPDLMSFTARFKLSATEDSGQLFGLSDLPGLTFNFVNHVDVDAYFKAAYDTFGVREFIYHALNGQINPGDIADGFYLATDDSNDPNHPNGCHLNLSGDISVGPKFNFVAFQAGVSGGASADLHLWATDPNGTGKFHLNDLFNGPNGLQEAGHLFNASGDVEAGLTAFIKIGVEVLGKFVGYEKDFDLANVRLIDFGTASVTGNPYMPPADLKLATQDPKDPSRLLLNLGQRATFLTNDQDLAGQHDVTFSVTHLGNNPKGGEIVQVSAFGFQQKFGTDQGIKTIVVKGANGNDVITIAKGVLSGADITEGDGNVQIQYIGSGNAHITAGNGNDLVTGGHGYNYVRTGSGDSTLTGGDGSTATVPPTWAQAQTANGTLYVNDLATGSGSGTNQLQGGAGLNHLVATGHGANQLTAGQRDDYLEGDGGTDTFTAGGGHDAVELGGGTNTVFWQVGDGNLDVRTNDVLSTNALQVVGSNGADTFSLAPNGQMGGLDVEANAALIHWVGFINEVSLDGAGGSDDTTVADMETSWVTDIGLNDGEALSPDGSPDVINVQGSPNYHTILVKTESAFLHPENTTGGVMLVQTHPHYLIHAAVVNHEDTLNVFAEGANNAIDVRSNTGHTVVFADAGSDTFHVSSDAPTDTGTLLEPQQQQRPPFGLFGTLDLHAGPGSNALTVSESGSTQADHVVIDNGSISGGPLHSFDPVSGLPVVMTWQVNYDTPANGSFAGGIVVKTGTAADDVRVRGTPANAPVTVRTGGGGDQITVGAATHTLDAIGGPVTVDGGDGTAVLTADDKNAGVPENYLVSFSQIVGNFLTRGSVTVVYRNVGSMTLKAGDLGNGINVNAIGDAAAIINAGGGDDTITVGDVSNQLAVGRPLTVNGQGGTDQLVLHDERPRLAPVDYQVSASVIQGSGFQPISYSSIAALTLHTATSANGTNQVNVLGTGKGTATALDLGASNHAVAVGDAANTLDSLNGPLAVHGQSGAQNVLTVRDLGAGTHHTYALGADGVSRSGAADITYDHLTGMALWAGQAKPNTIDVRGTGAGVQLTTVNTGNAGDSVRLGDASHTLNGFFSPLSVQGGSGNNTLAGPDQAVTWGITGADAGTLANGLVDFSGMRNLEGGTQADVFQILTGGSLSGLLNGGSGGDTLDYSAFAGDVAVNLALGTATNLGAVRHVANVTGGLGNSLIVGGSVVGLFVGGAGRNLIIGHAAGSELRAGGGDSLLIGGRTDYDTDPAALDALIQEWASNQTLGQRIGFLTLDGGLNGSAVLNTSTVHRNGSYSLFGSLDPAETNWFFLQSLADVQQSKSTDIFTMIV
jgi:hypothetical protein